MKDIQLKDICKSFYNDKKEQVLLDKVNLTIKDKKVIAFVGKSGAGKSTLLKIIGMFDTHYKGEYWFENENIGVEKSDRKLSKKRNQYIGYISQEYHLIEKFSVFDNIAVPLMLRNIKYEEMQEKVKNVANRLDIVSLINKDVHKLSGGERQRVCVARALVGKPSIIIADEPTAALDKENTDMIISLLKDCNKDSTIIIATHDDMIIDFSDSVYRIKGGKLKKK